MLKGIKEPILHAISLHDNNDLNNEYNEILNKQIM